MQLSDKKEMKGNLMTCGFPFIFFCLCFEWTLTVLVYLFKVDVFAFVVVDSGMIVVG